MTRKRFKWLGPSGLAVAFVVFSAAIPKAMGEDQTKKVSKEAVEDLRAINEGINKENMLDELVPLAYGGGAASSSLVQDLPHRDAVPPRIEPLRMPPPSVSGKTGLSINMVVEYGAGSRDVADSAKEDTFTSSDAQERIWEELGSDIDPKQVRLAKKKGPHAPEFREVLSVLRSGGRSAVLADRIQPKGINSLNRRISAQELNNISPKKLTVAPLPTKDAMALKDCQRSRRVEELKEKTQNETDPGIREHNLLLLAGLLVGQDDWEAARAVYKELEVKSEDPAVLEAVRRNLEVVERKIAILAETDPVRKELLALELANLHRDLGHDRAAKRVYRHLATTAKEPGIRSQAMEMLSTSSKPGRLPAPPGFEQAQ